MVEAVHQAAAHVAAVFDDAPAENRIGQIGVAAIIPVEIPKPLDAIFERGAPSAAIFRVEIGIPKKIDLRWTEESDVCGRPRYWPHGLLRRRAEAGEKLYNLNKNTHLFVRDVLNPYAATAKPAAPAMKAHKKMKKAKK